jgi:hypothetical protein
VDQVPESSTSDLPVEQLAVDRLSDDFLWAPLPKKSKESSTKSTDSVDENSKSTKSKSRRSTRRKSSLFNPVKRLKPQSEEDLEEKVTMFFVTLS